MKILDKYSTDKGRVQLIEDDGRYYCDSVLIFGSGCELRKISPKTSYAAAVEFYRNIRMSLDGDIRPQKECVRNPGHIVPCSYQNCPKELGGAVYWEIFRNMCRYQKVK